MEHNENEKPENNADAEGQMANGLSNGFTASIKVNEGIHQRQDSVQDENEVLKNTGENLANNIHDDRGSHDNLENSNVVEQHQKEPKRKKKKVRPLEKILFV